jgi:hypothetical protein
MQGSHQGVANSVGIADPNLCCKDLDAALSKGEGEGAMECKEGQSLQPFWVPILFLPLQSSFVLLSNLNAV